MVAHHLRAQDTASLHYRATSLLVMLAAAGGVFEYESSPSSLVFLEDFMQVFRDQRSTFAAWVAGCLGCRQVSDHSQQF